MTTDPIQTQAMVPASPMAVGLSYNDANQFAHIQRVATMFSESALVPQQFQKNVANCVIALEIAQRLSASPLAIMQSLYLVHGKPGWSSQFVIACLNTCGRFEPLMFEMAGTGDAKQCTAWALPRGVKLQPREDKKPWTIALAKEAGYIVLDGPPVSIAMAKAEGWFGKNGSKWQTLPDLMLRYRAASFFGSLYAPELKMGMKSVEEVIDVGAEVISSSPMPEVRFGPKQIEVSAAPAEQFAQEIATAPQESPAVTEQPKAAAETNHPPADPPADPKPSKKKESAPQEAPLHEQTAQFYQRECNADFTQVLATRRRMTAGWASGYDPKSYAELQENHLKDLWGGRRGIMQEVRRDLTGKA